MFYNKILWKVAFVFCILLLITWTVIFIPPYSGWAYSSDTEISYVVTDIHSTTTEAIVPKQGCNLSVCSIGNLGNQIWEYMSLFVVWKKFIRSGYTPYIDETMLENLKVFFPNLTIKSNRSLCHRDRETEWVIKKSDPIVMYESWFKEGECKDILLEQYSSRYDEVIEYRVDKLKKEMRYSPALLKKCRTDLDGFKEKFGFKNESVTFVGMHYRGTDYIQHLQKLYGSYNPVIADYKYYVKAMGYFQKTYKNVIFIMISIDKGWLKENLAPIQEFKTVIVNPYVNDRVHDLVLLSLCDHNIINYGTFGATAALFAGGTTFVYDLKLPLDHRGSTVALGIAAKLKNWFVISP